MKKGWAEDFSFWFYRQILETVKSNYEVRLIAEAIELNKQDRLIRDPIAFLRHDVDVSPKQAVNISRIEQASGIKSTYYVRVHAKYYNLDEPETLKSIHEIKNMGHDIGLHYDKREDGSLESTIHQLEQTTNTPVSSIAFHMPSTKQFNLGLKFRGKINTYSKELRVRYKSDSGGIWQDGYPIEELEKNDKPIQILTHPIWWGKKTIPETKRHEITMNLIKGW